MPHVPLVAPPTATILICYHPPRQRRPVEDNYTQCDYCLTMRETTANWLQATVRYHTKTALYDDQKRLISSDWQP